MASSASPNEAQWCLIEGTWILHGDVDDKDAAQSPAVQLARQVVHGDLSEALTSRWAKELFSASFPETSRDPSSSVFDFENLSVVRESTRFVSDDENELIMLAVGVAALHAFVQANWTGPDLDVTPLAVLNLPSSSSSTSEDDVHASALGRLQYGGEPAYHLPKHPSFLVLAQLVFALPFQRLESIHWWRLRAAMVHQHLLDEPVPVPEDVLSRVQKLLSSLAYDSSSSSSDISAFPPSWRSDLHARLTLERGLVPHHFGQDREAADLFVEAARQSGLEYVLTGALGRKTKFQSKDLSQLVLLAESREREERNDQDEGAKENVVRRSEGKEKQDSPDTVVGQKEGETGAAAVPTTLSLNDDTLLEHTKYTTTSKPESSHGKLSHIQPGSQPKLHPLDQCVLLALCLNIRNMNPSHGLTSEQMMAFVARVLENPMNWSVHTMALLLRSRLESNRSRTVERSALQLQALIDQMPTTDSTLQERLRYFHSMPLPSRWEMQHELAKRYLSIGVVRSALEIFERLEMWEDVVACWQLLEREDKGVEVVRDLLEGRRKEVEVRIAESRTGARAPEERSKARMSDGRKAKLWCLLGDLEKEPKHYHTAWEVSHHQSSRAMRSLGGYHYARGEFAESIEPLKTALSINPLYTRSWFVLGCAAMRAEDWEEAATAFGRCVALDDEDGESWNNLASVYLRMGEEGADKVQSVHDPALDEDDEEQAAVSLSHGALSTRPTASGVPYARKRDAFNALRQGIRHSQESWRIWTNYMIVAVDVGELSEACRAMARLVDILAPKIGEKAVDEDVLERLVDAVTRAPSREEDAVQEPSALAGETATKVEHNPNEGHGLYPRVERLFTTAILPRIASSPRTFRAYARLLLWRGDYRGAIDAYLKAFRCGAGSDDAGGAETSVEKFRKAAQEVEEMAEYLENLGPREVAVSAGEGGQGEGRTEPALKDWKFQARSIVRAFLGRTKDSFEDEPEYERLKEILAGLRSKD